METRETVRMMTDGQKSDIIATMVGAIPELTFDEAQYGVIGDKGSFVADIREVFAKRQARVRSTFPVKVDYGTSLEEMIASGRYDWTNSDIAAERFTHDAARGKHEVKIELVHFNRVLTSEEAIAELERMGCRPADLPELLALGAAFPDLQRQFPIVELGSVGRLVIGDRVVACLRRSVAERGLSLGGFDVEWSEVCRFAAVRK